MKAFVIGFALLLTPVAASAQTYGLAGCGLGSVVFGNDPGLIQVFAATTNGTSNSQTFGITSGTSNCVERPGSASLDQKAFVEINYASLERDVASGQGEYLSAFGTLLGCSAETQPAFNQWAQENHDNFFVNGSPAATLQAVKNAARANANLAGSCSRI